MPRAPQTSVVFSPEAARDSLVKRLTARPQLVATSRLVIAPEQSIYFVWHFIELISVSRHAKLINARRREPQISGKFIPL